MKDKDMIERVGGFMEYSACVWCFLLGLLPASASFIDCITYSINSEFFG